MEKRSFFESVKTHLIEKGQNMKKNNNTRGGNGQTADNVLENIDEYALKEVIIFVNSVADYAQKLSDGKVTMSQFETENAWLKAFGLEQIYKYVKKYEKTYTNIREQVREQLLMNVEIPSNLRGAIATKEKVETAEQELKQISSLVKEDYYNYELRKAQIDAQYKVRFLREMYKPNNLAYNNPTNYKTIANNRMESLKKLEEEFAQRKTATR